MNDVARKVAVAAHLFMVRIRERQEGATAAEYALLVALISVVIIGTVTALGGQINTAFDKVKATLSSSNTASTVIP